MTQRMNACITERGGHFQYAYAEGIVVAAEGRDMFTLGAIANGWRLIPSGKFPLGKKKNFGWMDVWGLNREGLGSLWLIASATLGESFWLKASMIGVGGYARFELYPGICLTTEENHEKTQDCEVVRHYLCRLGRPFRDSLGWPA
jgi:hypothetical protein